MPVCFVAEDSIAAPAIPPMTAPPTAPTILERTPPPSAEPAVAPTAAPAVPPNAEVPLISTPLALITVPAIVRLTMPTEPTE